MKRKFLLGIAIVLLMLSFTSTSYATAVTSAIDVVSNTFGEFSSAYGIDNVSDQSGLSVGFTSGVTDWDTYFGTPSHTVIAADYEWWGAENSGLTGSVVFDLGMNYFVDKLALWNEEVAGISTFDVYTSTDGISFTSVGPSLTPTNNPLELDYFADIFALTTTQGRYIKLDITGTGDNGWNTVSMGEIAFSTSTSVDPVPEPSTMLLLGCGLIGLAGTARRKLKK